MKINGKEYPVTERVNLFDAQGHPIALSVPVVGIPAMSDERWNELAARCKGEAVVA